MYYCLFPRSQESFLKNLQQTSLTYHLPEFGKLSVPKPVIGKGTEICTTDLELPESTHLATPQIGNGGSFP